ncbi:Taurine import ATP-binding protein TauB [Pseudomonas fluorescens]|uniref:Taurine import ATP-binding protein TauB n=1 Tax=Pseudomonas fluorescens TaxID=294 RepID=A0A125QHU4_PSEFL|nr:Taurine import ATP-binding protein TauB [Pseudomonas fluorescens]
MALLQLERISAQYPGAPEPVLSDISLELGPQQLLVALGPSGSGKTSLLNLIAGFVEPSAGRITLDGVPVKGPSAERGVVFQDDALLPWQDVLANVAFGLELAGVPKARAKCGRVKCSRWWTWPVSTTAASGNSPVARSNASAWRVRWRPTRVYC